MPGKKKGERWAVVYAGYTSRLHPPRSLPACHFILAGIRVLRCSPNEGDITIGASPVIDRELGLTIRVPPCKIRAPPPAHSTSQFSRSSGRYGKFQGLPPHPPVRHARKEQDYESNNIIFLPLYRNCFYLVYHETRPCNKIPPPHPRKKHKERRGGGTPRARIKQAYQTNSANQAVPTSLNLALPNANPPPLVCPRRLLLSGLRPPPFSRAGGPTARRGTPGANPHFPPRAGGRSAWGWVGCFNGGLPGRRNCQGEGPGGRLSPRRELGSGSRWDGICFFSPGVLPGEFATGALVNTGVICFS